MYLSGIASSKENQLSVLEFLAQKFADLEGFL